MADKKIVILGARGMLGSDIAKLLISRGKNPACFDLPNFDITDSKQLQNAAGDADIIINCAAFTDVDKAETKSSDACAVNAEAVGSLAKIAAENNAYIIHISTDFVFDGTKHTPYTETDEPNPVNVYGQSKLSGEKLLTQSTCRNSIIRVQWSYGQNGDNFIKKLISLSTRQDSLKVVSDQIGSPTATAETAKVIAEFVEKQPLGLYHFAAAGYAGRFEVAKFVFDKLNIKTELAPCLSSEFPAPAKRPCNSRFCCDKISQLLNCDIESWNGPLERFLKKL
ncbi:MAG: dTDP-4-dehydrorhamnose reductase [Anaerohalosphaeraceae bacterium]|nr:dTDP-4-dehydrorhamnose reductase [Anaerohalosphaeraceae bacterium]